MPRDKVVYFSNREFVCLDQGFLPDEEVDVVIRPEDLKIVPVSSGMLKGKVESVIFKGVHYEMIVQGECFKWMIHSTKMEPVGTEVGLEILPDDIHVMKKVKK